jgi:anti-anti-sigma factor
MNDHSVDQNELDRLLSELITSQNSFERLFNARLVEPGILLIKVSGRILGQCESLEIIRKITNSMSGKDLLIILDLSDCSYLSSLVLGALARIAENVIKADRKICAFGANETIIDLLTLTMFREFIEIRETLDDAIAYCKRIR